jgi:hypothetical protein
VDASAPWPESETIGRASDVVGHLRSRPIGSGERGGWESDQGAAGIGGFRFNAGGVSNGVVYELLRVRTQDGGETTVYLVRHPRATTRLTLQHFPMPTPVAEPWCERRACVHLDGGGSAPLVRAFLNRPYSDMDQPSPESRAIVTALLFDRV